MADEIHVGDIGSQFRLAITDDGVAVDISEYTGITITIKKPSGIRIEKDGSLYTDGTDGIVYCSSEDGDLDEVGTYKIQARIEINGGTFNSSVGSFKVHHNI